jgi:hypothetical protein
MFIRSEINLQIGDFLLKLAACERQEQKTGDSQTRSRAGVSENTGIFMKTTILG